MRVCPRSAIETAVFETLAILAISLMVGLFSIDLTLKQKVDKLEKNVKKKFFR